MAWSAGGIHDDYMLIKLELVHPKRCAYQKMAFSFFNIKKRSLIHIHWIDSFGLYINIHKINHIAEAED